MPKKQILIIGGGAAGFFLAANIPFSKKFSVTILEKSHSPLQKVKISGGGRCNVTHACFDPNDLIQFYPRGEKELRSIFHKFQPADTMQWFEDKGVSLKIEDDNRVFPISNSSQTIIDVLENEVKKNKVEVCFSTGVNTIKKENGIFIIETQNKEYIADFLIISSGSSPKMWETIKKLGHTIINPLPSLFTFNIKNKKLNNLMGISFENVEISIPKIKLEEQGAVLITHWGISGPAVLRLSAWGAIDLAQEKYTFDCFINWIATDDVLALEKLMDCKNSHPKKMVFNYNPFQLTSRFWHFILEENDISNTLTFADISKEKLLKINQSLTKMKLEVKGKSTFKDEFVTCGGVDLKEIDFRSMQSKIHPNLFFAGEVLNIDAITGGFNFQACWSESFVISEFLKHSLP